MNKPVSSECMKYPITPPSINTPIICMSPKSLGFVLKAMCQNMMRPAEIAAYVRISTLEFLL